MACLLRRNATVRLYELTFHRLAILVVCLLCQIEGVRAFAHHEAFNELASARDGAGFNVRAFCIYGVEFRYL